MHALLSRTSHRTACISSITNGSPRPRPSAMPLMRTRRPAATPISWHSCQLATYYFDASHQSVKTLRVLLADYHSGVSRPGQLPPTQLLAHSFDVLLNSIRPGMPDDFQSRDYFFSLLRMHLAGLTGSELENLTLMLTSLPYDCFVAESVNDDNCLRKYGFTNGPPHHQIRTLLQTKDLFNLLDGLQQQAVCNEARRHSLCTQALVPIARTWLASCATNWLQSDKSLVLVLDSARELAGLLKVPAVPDKVMAANLASRASVVDLIQSELQIEQGVACHLAKDDKGKLFAYVLRDLLELMLMKKLFGDNIVIKQLTAEQRREVFNCLAQIIDYGRPPAVSAENQAQATAVLADKNLFGKVQILPTIGAALGHACISPALSLTSDAAGLSVTSGMRFLHTGFQLVARESLIREWPTRFLSAEENDHVFPAASAWHLPVPVATQELQTAAETIVREWRKRGLPYRFIGIDPTIDATGCRITVWQAVQQGMTADALALFKLYNLGLPEPESPTELWLRLDGMMRWLEQLKSPNPALL